VKDNTILVRDATGEPIEIATTNIPARTPLGFGAPAYTIRVTRLDYAGRKTHVEFDSYGVLRELLDDIEASPLVQAWLAESDVTPA
jgi:hypothetical protein